MALKWKYTGTLKTGGTLNTNIADSWEQTLKAEQARIFSALTTKIASGTDFTNKIATPSSTQFSNFLATVGARWDRTNIILKQKVKLGSAYSRWLTSITAIFGSGGTFGAIVTAKKGKLASLQSVLNIVGTKAWDQWRPASKAVLLMRGDTRPLTYIDPTYDIYSPNTSAVEAVFDAKLGALVTPSLIAEVVYGCMMAKYAYDAGDNTSRDSIIVACNATLASLVAVALDTTHKTTGYVVALTIAWNNSSLTLDVVASDTHPT